MNIVRNNLKKHGVKFLKKDTKLETLSIRLDLEIKKKLAEYLDQHFPLPNKEIKQSQFQRFLNYVFKNLARVNHK